MFNTWLAITIDLNFMSSILKGIPTMPMMVHPIAFIYLCNTSARNFSCQSRKSATTIIVKVLSPPRRQKKDGKEALLAPVLVIVKQMASPGTFSDF